MALTSSGCRTPMRELARVLGAALLVPVRVQTPCYHYARAVVTLEGALLWHGPPGSRHPARAPRGGRSEPTMRADTALVLALPTPICVAPDSASPDPDKRLESGAREWRLAIGRHPGWSVLPAHRGRPRRVPRELVRPPSN